jgi:hypothetical protein
MNELSADLFFEEKERMHEREKIRTKQTEQRNMKD